LVLSRLSLLSLTAPIVSGSLALKLYRLCRLAKFLKKIGQSNYQAAFGQILWWLKRRWARLAFITAVESRHAAFGCFGGSAQQQAAVIHAQAQAQDDWRDGGAYR
jgi:hypothetical protein